MRVFLLARFSKEGGEEEPDYGILHDYFRSLGVYNTYTSGGESTNCDYYDDSWWSLDDMHVELRVKQQLC